MLLPASFFSEAKKKESNYGTIIPKYCIIQIIYSDFPEKIL